MNVSAPRKLWKTNVVVWTDYPPRGMDPQRLVNDASMNGHVQLGEEFEISNPYDQPDGPPPAAFEDYED